MLKDSIIKFFNDKFLIDVSNVAVTSTQLEGTELANYNHLTNEICIDTEKIQRMYKGVSDIVIDTTVVHELVHLCQFKHNKSLILPINGIFTGRLVNNRYVHLPAYQQPVEIDALVMECYYLYCSGEYNNEGIVFYAEHMLANVKGEDVLQYTQRLKDDGFSLLISQIKNMKECC